MWVLEGDEVVAVNGTNVEGKSLDEVPVAEPHRNTVGLHGGKALKNQQLGGGNSNMFYLHPYLGK